MAERILPDDPLAPPMDSIVEEDTGRGQALARRRSQVWWWQWVIVLAGVVMHGWAMAGGYFHMDDFFYLADASNPFLDYVFQIYNNHLMPAEFGVVWVSQALAPMSWTLAVIIATTMWFFFGWGVLAVMRRAFGNHPVGFIALALIMFGPILTTVSVWYASALQVLPWGATFVWLLYFAIRDSQQPAHRWWIAGTLVYIVGLAFWEKSLLALPVVLWVAWRMWPGEGRLGLRKLGRRWILPIVTLAISIPYGLWYLALQPEAVLRSDPSGDQVLQSARIGIGEVLLPGMFGAPWTGFSDGLTPFAGREWWILILIWQVVAIALVASVVRWRSSINIWAVVIVYSVITIALFSLGRINAFGLVLVYDPRYIEDLYIVASVLLPFAFVRGRGSRLPEPRTLNLISMDNARWMWPATGLVMTNLLFLSSLTVGWSWQDSEAKTFIDNARVGLDANPDVPVLDRLVPPGVMAPLFLERAAASYVLSGLRIDVDWNGSGPTLYALADDGTLYNPTIGVAARSFPGPNGSCGWRVFNAPTSVGLDRELFAWPWMGRMEYVASADDTLSITMSDQVIEVPVVEGVNTVEFLLTGEGDQVLVSASEDVGVCVWKITMGQPVGAP